MNPRHPVYKAGVRPIELPWQNGAGIRSRTELFGLEGRGPTDSPCLRCGAPGEDRTRCFTHTKRAFCQVNFKGEVVPAPRVELGGICDTNAAPSHEGLTGEMEQATGLEPVCTWMATKGPTFGPRLQEWLTIKVSNLAQSASKANLRAAGSSSVDAAGEVESPSLVLQTNTRAHGRGDGWGRRSRTYTLTASETAAMPLGDSPTSGAHGWN